MARLATILLFIAVTAPFIAAQCNYRNAAPYFKRSVSEFTWKLVTRINQETDSHFVATALSPWTLIAAISLGASEETLLEIRRVLKLHPNRCFNNLFFSLATHATGKEPGSTENFIERSSTIFFDGSLSIKPSFFNRISALGMCDARIVSFADPLVTSAIVNQHVNTATHGTVDEIVTAADLEDMLVLMIDALYFKGLWKVPFPYEDTENESAFYNSNGQQIGAVSLMYVSSNFNITHVPQIRSTVVELPYGNGSKNSMLVILPDGNVTISTVLDLMKRISITTIYVLFRNNGPQHVDVQIPRFRISSDINNLKELLIDMGLQTLFDQNKANFPGISDYQLALSNFIQKADIEVTEDGTVSSAASAVLFESRIMPDQFVANRPFLFMIVDRRLHVPIFTGAYSKPVNY